MDESKLSLCGIFVRDRNISNEIERTIRERWRENNIFQELSDVRKGIVPFQIMQCIDDLKPFMDVQFTKKQLGRHLSETSNI